MPGPRLILVDDDRDYCADLEAVLGGRFQVFQAHSGSGALEMMDEVVPDVILLDVDFGEDGMSGLEILERVRALENPPPVIMLSGSQSLSVVVRAMKTCWTRLWLRVSIDARSRRKGMNWDV